MATERKMPTHAAVYHFWRINGCEFVGDNRRQCFMCGWEAPKGLNLERAHILPRCEGGSDELSNLHLLCHVCHRLTEYLVPRDRYWKFFRLYRHDNCDLENG